ncbi:hypothetical protein CWB41_08135 [Methylovirgula ligni]|uniref:Uncharacterized protein n=1 Tax=Methylovirgula ligni TaxID=569860 RepID=A0A3D9Z1H6_9HYPH|nr:hypothetical protein [Methylovirgula ligni]QAY95711.1 hypothetical protein CWB41_08135 [Methylovirgula ligni]REF88921.1 hypothetical protein DES32_0132 [Methylovirgula ligni]
MNVSSAFAGQSLDEIKAALDGGTLTIYSVARPLTADHAVDRSGVLATFTFASPAFSEPQDGLETPVFVEASVLGAHDGTPGFARAKKADGTVVADFSAGPGAREIKFAEVSISPGAPVKIVRFQILPDGSWPERPEYYDTHPRVGFPMPANP